MTLPAYTYKDFPGGVISASQLKSGQACLRQVCFSHVFKLPRLQDQRPFTYGTAVHEVLERYLRADELGRGPDGEPVELFPEGWHKNENGTLTPEEQALIRRLVPRAIEAGVVERHPEAEVEREFFLPVVGEPGEPGAVGFVGYVDVVLPDEVQDHKTGNPRYWLSAKRLATDPQMLCYGKFLLEERRAEGNDLQAVRLRHNQISSKRENPVARRTGPVEVSADEVEEFWRSEVVPFGETMRDLRTLHDSKELTEDDWEQLPGPDDPDTCNAYGGCPFRAVCFHGESPASLRSRINRHNAGQAAAVPALPATDENPMNALEKLKARRKAAQSKPETKPETKPDEQPAEAPPPAEPREADFPPWRVEGCRACSNNPNPGFNSKGKPCRICDGARDDAKIAIGEQSFAYEVGIDADGERYTWTPKDAEAGLAAGWCEIRTEPARAEVREPAPQAPVVKTAETKPATPPPGKKPSNTTDEKPRRRGRPPEGWTLLVNCVPERGKKRNIFHLSRVFDEVAEALAEKSPDVDSYWELDPFRRRDAIAAEAEKIASRFGSGYVLAFTGSCPDRNALLEALEPFAQNVVRGTR